VPTTDTPTRPNRLPLLALGGVVALAAGIVLYGLFSRPPQMGASDEVFHTVDALYTAVRNRDEKRVGECERRLHGYRESGELPAAAANALDAVVRRTRSGEWEAAAERLYEFMLAQRRDGAETRPEPKTKSKPTGPAKLKR
jgi:hypothetical protein